MTLIQSRNQQRRVPSCECGLATDHEVDAFGFHVHCSLLPRGVTLWQEAAFHPARLVHHRLLGHRLDQGGHVQFTAVQRELQPQETKG